MKKLCLAILAATAVQFASAQTDLIYNWAKALNNNQYYSGSILADNVAVDMQGNVHVIGSFKGTADFDPNPVSAFHLTSVNNYYDIFIAKYDSNGSLIYAKQMERSESSGATGDIAVDADGNVYVAGKIDVSFFSKYDSSGELVFSYNPPFTPVSIALDSEGSILLTGTFLSTPDFDLGAGTASLTSAGSADIFVAKYDGDGNYLYAIGMGGTGDDSGNSITVDEANNAHVTGYFSNTADFDPSVSAADLSSAGSYDVFLAKYDSAGNYVFAIAAGAAGNDRGLKVAVDNSGNALVTGYFNNTVDFNPGAGTANLTSNGGNDAFLAKYNGSGNFIYALGLGGTSSDAGASVTTDSSGNAYVAGYFRNTVDFDPGAGTTNLTSTGQDDAFFAMYDAAGNYLFAKQLGGTNSDAGSDITIDNSGKIIATGYFRGTADFDPGAGTSNLSGNTSNNNAFIGKYSGNGDYGWAIGILGYSNSSTEFQDEGRDIKIDASGNVYVTGSFSGTVDFDPGAGTQLLTSAGNTDIFMAKYDASGNFVFAFPLGAAGQDGGYSLGLDAGSNIYLTGYFSSTVDFDPGAPVVSLASAGSRDIFLAKYSSSGAFIFANRMGASGSETAYAMALDATSNIYLAGNFESTVDFDPGIGSVTLTSAGGLDIFFAKYTSAGAFVYARKIGGNMTDHAFDIAADASGIVYLTGYFTGTVDFDPGAGTVNLVSVGGSSDYDVYFAKYDASGNYVYANSIGTSSTQEQGYSITTDGLGNAYVSGTCSFNADFDPGPGTVNIAGSGSFLAKYNTTGNYVYAMRTGLGYALYADGSGNTYAAGSFQGTIDFDPGAGLKSLTAIGSTDIFIAKYDASGNYLFAKSFGGIDLDIAYGLSLDASGNIHITGAFRNTADFDPGYGAGTISSTNSNDIFLAKYSQTGNSISTSALSENVLCRGSSTTVSFISTGTYNAGNEFIAQLSKANGSFSNPAAIGSLSGITSGTINITIPQNATIGSGYRIRVVSANPEITGTDNGSNIAIQGGCSDGNPCTDDICTNGVCSYPNNTSSCDDADACTDNDVCSNGVCDGTPVNCDDNDPSTEDVCVNGVCVHRPICTQQTISLASGWNTISGYVIPDLPNMTNVFEEVVLNIILVKNNAGATYIPAFSINNIGNWDITQGYKIKTNAAASLTLGCTAADPETPISLNANWNMIAYLRSSAMSVPAALASLGGNVILVKNNAGQTYIPAFSINNIGNMLPGQGYQIKMLAGGTLTYPAARLSSPVGDDYTEQQASVHFITPLNTGSNATIIFPQGALDGYVSEGDEIAVLNADGNVAGVAVAASGAFALTAWGDDASTQNIIEGMADNEPFRFVHWSSANGMEQPLALNFEEGADYFTANGISSVSGKQMTSLSDMASVSGSWMRCFPNPSTGLVYFEFHLSETAEILWNIYDYTGKKAIRRTADMQSGNQKIGIDMSTFAEGQYLAEVIARGSVMRQRFAIVR